jgi:hypothetical protein
LNPNDSPWEQVSAHIDVENIVNDIAIQLHPNREWPRERGPVLDLDTLSVRIDGVCALAVAGDDWLEPEQLRAIPFRKFPGVHESPVP